MSYIGNQPTSVAFLTDQFSGTGSQTAFTLSAAPANTASIIVAVSGVLQDPTTYSTSGLTLTFSAAPPSGTGNISVRFLGIPASNIATTAYRTLTEFTATAGQTTFTVPSYTVGYISVYRNGVMLGTADFTATNGTTVVLATGATAGDLITTESFYVSSVLNAIPATAGAVTTPYILDGAVTAAKMAASGAWAPAGTILQVASGYKTDTQTISSGIPTFVDVTGLSVTLTPRSSSSKFLCIWALNLANGTDGGTCHVRLNRNGSAIALGDAAGSRTTGSSAYINTAIGGEMLASTNSYLDSPATASAVTYKLTVSSNNTSYVNRSARDNDSANYDGRVTSSITILEIAG